MGMQIRLKRPLPPKKYRVWIVWGPTSEWGEGSGPLSYFKTKREAEWYLAELKRREKEEGRWSWRSVFECGCIDVADARDIGIGMEPGETLDEFIERMNSYV
jgi:hypothetical protein